MSVLQEVVYSDREWMILSFPFADFSLDVERDYAIVKNMSWHKSQFIRCKVTNWLFPKKRTNSVL